MPINKVDAFGRKLDIILDEVRNEFTSEQLENIEKMFAEILSYTSESCNYMISNVESSQKSYGDMIIKKAVMNFLTIFLKTFVGLCFNKETSMRLHNEIAKTLLSDDDVDADAKEELKQLYMIPEKFFEHKD